MNLKSYNNQVVWIIGASSGIGAALAEVFVSLGARVAISARRADALKKVADDSGAQWVLPLDVTEITSIRSASEELQRQAGQIDRIICLSGIYAPMQLDQLDLDELRGIVEVNLLGTFNLVSALYPFLIEQGQGQLAFCASISGYTGLPYSQPYASTKAAMINLTESLQIEAVGTGVDIKIISPGFVRTPLTDKNQFKMPFIVEPEVAANRIAKGLKRSGFEIVFPRRFALLLKLIGVLPYWMRLKLLQQGKKKLEI